MSTYDDPNREVLGLAPAWVEGTGGGDGNPEVEPPGEDDDPATNPGAYTVAALTEWAAGASRPDLESALAAEKAGYNRTTAVTALEHALGTT